MGSALEMDLKLPTNLHLDGDRPGWLVASDKEANDLSDAATLYRCGNDLARLDSAMRSQF